MSCHIARNRRITIVYRRIEFVTWNLSHGYRLLPHRICHVDIVYRHIVIVYCHIVIVYRRINVVTCSSSHSTAFRATVETSNDTSLGSPYKLAQVNNLFILHLFIRQKE